MSKKHFRALAADFRARLQEATPEQRTALWDLAREVATTLRGFNGRFDREKFLDACGF